MLGYVEKIKEFFYTLYQTFLKILTDTKNSLKDMRDRSKDLLASNIDLAYFHLNKGNLADAIMRFKIIIYFLPEKEKIKYYYDLGRCYLYNGKLTKAVENLKLALQYEQNKEKTEKRLQIVKDKDHLTDVPLQIISEDYDFFVTKFTQFVKNEKYLAPEETISFFKSCYKEKPESKKKEVIEIGCGFGLAGYLLKISYPHFEITGIDISPRMIEEAKLLNTDNTFKELIAGNYLQPLEKNKKFDIVLSVMSLQFSKNLKDRIINIKQKLNPEGIIIACIPVLNSNQNPPEASFSMQDQYFYYSEEYVKNSFKEADFEIIDYIVKQVTVSSKAILIFCKCKKDDATNE